MAVIQIPNLTPAIALNGTEQLEAVQAGTTVRVTSAQIALLASPFSGNPLPVSLGGTGLQAGTSGGVPYFNSTSSMLSSALLANNAIMIGGGAGGAPSTITTGTGVVSAIGNAINTSNGLLAAPSNLAAGSIVVGGGSGVGPSTTATGTGVVTALGVNVGTAGAFVVNGGALGTPSSGVLSNCSALPVATGISGLGTGVATALAINVGSAGSIVTRNGALGTPSSGTLSSCSGLPVSTGISGLGTSVATALAVNIGSAGSFVTNGGVLGTPSSGTLSSCSGLPVSTGISGLGTNVASALAINVGSSGAVVVNGGALGTPSSGTLSSCSGLPVSTGISGLGAGVATFLATPSSANLASAVTDETGTTGTYNLVFSGQPTITGLTLAAGTATVDPLTFTSGTNLTSPISGSVEYDGANFYSTIAAAAGRGYIPSVRRFTLFSAGGAITTIANYFGATSNIPLTASSVYDIEIVMYFAKTTTNSVTFTLTNSAAPTSMNVHYEMSPITGVVAPPGTATLLVGETVNSTAASYTVTTGNLTTGVNHYVRFKIWLSNASGTSLQVQATANTAGSITPGIGSYWTCTRVPSSNTGTYTA